MDFLNLLIRPGKYLCLFCFKESGNMTDVYTDMEIEEKFFSATLTLADMIKYLFPCFEITLSQICDDCYNLILKMYIKLRRNIITKKIINSIIDSLNNEIDISNGFNCYLNINLREILDIKQEISKKNILEDSNNECFDKEDNTEEEKQCPQCFKLFNNTKQYKKHIKDHKRYQKRKYYNCSYCIYKSLCRTSVDGHINKYHLKTRPHICQICYKSFYHKKNLVDHEASHEKDRNDICEICGERFLHKKNLLQHLKLHSGTRPYECEICSKRFITSGRRLEHMKRIHGEKTEDCLLCDKKFSLAKQLTRHMKKVHLSL